MRVGATTPQISPQHFMRSPSSSLACAHGWRRARSRSGPSMISARCVRPIASMLAAGLHFVPEPGVCSRGSAPTKSSRKRRCGML